jgi:hypothetical protein
MLNSEGELKEEDAALVKVLVCCRRLCLCFSHFCRPASASLLIPTLLPLPATHKRCYSLLLSTALHLSLTVR